MDENYAFPPFARQTWSIAGILLHMLSQGMVFSYPSCLMPALKDPESEIKADLETASWIASSVGSAGIPGFFLSSFLMEKWGRKIAHFLIILPGCIGWITLYFASNVTALLIGRILNGITAGGTVGLSAVVIGEYTSPSHRGMFLNLKTAAVCLGGMTVHILGNFFHWRPIALMALVPHIIALLIILTWPESPAWLAHRGQFAKSETAFFWLRGKDENSVRELENMIQAQMAQTSKTENLTLKEKLVDFLKKFTRKDFVKPVILVILGACLLEVSGRHLFPAYALDIMGEVTGNKTQSFYFTLALDLIITTSATFSSFLVKIMKRRTLLFATGFASVAVLAGICTYLLLVAKEVISKEHSYIPITMFVVYFILVNLGCTPIPLAFLGELFPLAHRSAGSSIGGIVFSLLLNLTLQMTPFLLVNVKVHGTFAIVGTCMAILLTILYFTLPETKDKTLQEIEDYFNNGKYKEDSIKGDDEEAKMKMIVNDTVKIGSRVEITFR